MFLHKVGSGTGSREEARGGGSSQKIKVFVPSLFPFLQEAIEAKASCLREFMSKRSEYKCQNSVL